jgi:RimJ/RimL family protein N-acetyltransferase
LAVVVRDDWQGKGLRSILLTRVINIGRENGFSRFEATIDPENQIILNIFRRSGYDYKIYHREQGVYHIEIQT